MTAVAMDARLPSPRRGVVVRQENADHFAVDLDTGDIFEMNESAAFILDACRRGLTFGALVDEMAARYGAVPREELARDADELLREMRKANLLA